jgi:hypothetical protein
MDLFALKINHDICPSRRIWRYVWYQCLLQEIFLLDSQGVLLASWLRVRQGQHEDLLESQALCPFGNEHLIGVCEEG